MDIAPGWSGPEHLEASTGVCGRWAGGEGGEGTEGNTVHGEGCNGPSRAGRWQETSVLLSLTCFPWSSRVREELSAKTLRHVLTVD